MADYSSALAQFMKRASEGEDTVASPEEADWYLLTRSEVRFSRKPGPRAYLCLAPEEIGTVVVYPRTSLKGEAPSGNQYPDQPYPLGVFHRAHAHTGRRCDLDKDATVLACEPRTVGAYVLRIRSRHCIEDDQTWLTQFSSAVSELGSDAEASGAGDDC